MGPQYTRTETERATTPYYTEGRRGSPWLHEVAPRHRTLHTPLRLQATRAQTHWLDKRGLDLMRFLCGVDVHRQDINYQRIDERRLSRTNDELSSVD